MCSFHSCRSLIVFLFRCNFSLFCGRWESFAINKRGKDDKQASGRHLLHYSVLGLYQLLAVYARRNRRSHSQTFSIEKSLKIIIRGWEIGDEEYYAEIWTIVNLLEVFKRRLSYEGNV